METSQPTPPRKNTIPLQLGIATVIILLFFGILIYKKQTTSSSVADTANTGTGKQDAATSQAVPPPSTTTGNTGSTNTSGYKDGTYSAAGAYMSPGGREQIGVRVTVKNGVVTAVTVTPKANSDTSAEYQKEFAGNIQQYVIGKSIASLSVSKVAGSSLTGVGFNAAITQIKAQAAS